MKNNTPSISIVILSLLRHSETKKCIESIFQHTDVPFEVIIVDMGKSEIIIDWLLQLKKEYSNIQIILNNENIGTSKGRNQGWKIAQADWVVFLDNDTIVCKNWLTPLFNCVKSNDKIVACGSKIISPTGQVMNCSKFIRAKYFEEKLKEIGLEFLNDYNSEDNEINQTCEVPWYPTTCLMVKKTVLEVVAGFDESFFICEEDKDLCLKIREFGGEIYYVPSSQVIHHHNNKDQDYTLIRNNTLTLLKDIKTFEKKWNCKVFIHQSRTFLQNRGYTDATIDNLKKRSFFNKIIEDELNINQLILTVTNFCNHACSFCYYHDNLNLENNNLTLDEYDKISKSIGKLKILWITGGEPFLQKNLVEICKLFIINNQVEHIFIPTNGSLPEKTIEYTQKILDIKENLKLTLMFSLEGKIELHDQLHGRKDAFRKMQNTIKKLNLLRIKYLRKKRSFNILLNTVVNSKNLEQMLETMEFASQNLLVDAHSLTPMRGEGLDNECIPPTGDEILDLYKKAKPYFEFYTRKAKLNEKDSNNYLTWLENRYELWGKVLNGFALPFECQAGNLIGVLEPDGGIRVCELKPIVANIRDFDYNFPKAWFSTQMNQSRKTVKGCSCSHACFLNASS